MVDCCRSNLVNVVSGVTEASVLCPLLFLVFTLDFFFILEYKLIGYADDFALIVVVSFPVVRITVAKSHNRYLDKVNKWCNLCGIKLNVSKTKTMIVSKSRTMHPQSLTIEAKLC